MHLDNSSLGKPLGIRRGVQKYRRSTNTLIRIYPLHYAREHALNVITCPRDENRARDRNFHLNINDIRSAATRLDSARLGSGYGLANVRRAPYCKSLSTLFKIAEVVYTKPSIEEGVAYIRSPIVTTVDKRAVCSRARLLV